MGTNSFVIRIFAGAVGRYFYTIALKAVFVAT